VNRDEQLLYEARTRRRVAVAAAIAGILPIVGGIAAQLGPQLQVAEPSSQLVNANDRVAYNMISAVSFGLGAAITAFVLVWLLGVVLHRNPEISPALRFFAIGGGVIFAFAVIVSSVALSIEAHRFVTEHPSATGYGALHGRAALDVILPVGNGHQTHAEAKHILGKPFIVASQVLVYIAQIALAAAFAMTSLNAMRVGLLTRFIGYIGVVAGILYVIPIGGPIPIVQAFWMFALAYLLSGRWPSGIPKSWQTGKA
jgi:MFS family permease